VRIFFGQGEGGNLQMWTSALFSEKTEFFGIYGVSARTRGGGGVSGTVGNFAAKGGGLFLSASLLGEGQFCADVLYERPLTIFLMPVLKKRTMVLAKILISTQVSFLV